MKRKILFTGGNGNFGKVFKKINHNKKIIAIEEIIEYEQANEYCNKRKNKSELEFSLIFKALIPILGIFDGSSNQTAVGITPGDDVIFGISTKTEFISFSS